MPTWAWAVPAAAVPVVAAASVVFGIPLVLGLDEPKDVVMLALAFLVSAVTLATGRTHVMQGAVHVVMFAAFLFLALVPRVPAGAASGRPPGRAFTPR